MLAGALHSSKAGSTIYKNKQQQEKTKNLPEPNAQTSSVIPAGQSEAGSPAGETRGRVLLGLWDRIQV